MTTVDAYIEQADERRRPALRDLRALLRRVLPGAAESMEYGMPTYRLSAEAFCAFAAQKQYTSVYLDVAVVARHRADLAAYHPGKSCVRFRPSQDLPLPLLETLLREARAAAIPG